MDQVGGSDWAGCDGSGGSVWGVESSGLLRHTQIIKKNLGKFHENFSVVIPAVVVRDVLDYCSSERRPCISCMRGIPGLAGLLQASWRLYYHCIERRPAMRLSVPYPRLLEEAMVSLIAGLGSLLEETKVSLIAGLGSFLEETKISLITGLGSLLEEAKISLIAGLGSLLEEATVSLIAGLGSLLEEAKVTLG
jgi:hypothetical protein